MVFRFHELVGVNVMEIVVYDKKSQPNNLPTLRHFSIFDFFENSVYA